MVIIKPTHILLRYIFAITLWNIAW